METRKVTIINSKTQNQEVLLNSKATTLGELKQEMRERNIDYDGMTFYEGHMRAELKDDAAPLPANIPYKGQLVSDLVFMLTTPDKKVKSGTMTRTEVYTEIKKRNLQSACVNKFGKNFTQCSTANLISLIEDNTETAVIPNAEKFAEPAPVRKKEVPTTGCNFSKALTTLAAILRDNDFIGYAEYDEIVGILYGDEDAPSAPKKMSKEEIDEMFSFIGE